MSSAMAASGESKIWVSVNGPKTCDPKVTSDLPDTPRLRKGLPRTSPIASLPSPSLEVVRADLGGHLKYSRRWSGVRAGVLLGAQGAVRRGENRGGL